MEKKIINVPPDIMYLSQWTDFNLPVGHCIIDKKVTGCGFTQSCLCGKEDVILCSPRLILLENKAEQNPHCFYFKSIRLKKKEKEQILKDKEPEEPDDIAIKRYIFKEHCNRVESYIQSRSVQGNIVLPLKFMVTYDSLKLFFYVLNTIAISAGRARQEQFNVVVDEFQLIFNDSYFKADVELELIQTLQAFSNVCYVSATPMMEKYLSQIPELSSLPYYELDWGLRIEHPSLIKIKTSTSVDQPALEIIRAYLSGNTESRCNCFGDLVVSKELVIYVNNIEMILRLIKAARLKNDQVNIIMSEDPENTARLVKFNKDLGLSERSGSAFVRGTVPLRGYPHKMFTFCTSTAYCGVDFYSTNARTLVLSNCNLNTMALDISLDLPQILGRQRLAENPWKNEAIFVYVPGFFETVTEDNMKEFIKEKAEHTLNIINGYNAVKKSGYSGLEIAEKIRSSALSEHYNKDYATAIPNRSGHLDVVYNKLVELTDWRAWEVVQDNYKNDINILNTVSSVGIKIEETESDTEKAQVYKILEMGLFADKMKLVCDIYEKDHRTRIFNYLSEKYKLYIDYLGVDEIRKCSYKESLLDRRFSAITSHQLKGDQLKELIHGAFKVGSTYTAKEIKATLGDIIESCDLQESLSPKATTLEIYFDVRKTLLNISGKRIRAYEILGIR